MSDATADPSSDPYEIADELSHEVGGIIRRHAGYAAVGGLIPIPLVEVFACGTIQLRMISQLCDVYDVPFSEQAVKAAIGSLVGAVLPVSSLGYGALSLSRAVPVVGPLLTVATIPALAAAVTWAVGRVFAWHFASGGTIGDFDVKTKKEAFKREFEEGKRRVSKLVRGKRAKEEQKDTSS